MTVPPDTEAVLAELRDAAAGLVSARHITDLDDALRGIVTAAVATVPGAEGGGISRTHGRRVTSHHPSTPRIARLDTTQSRLGEGPCVVLCTAHPVKFREAVEPAIGSEVPVPERLAACLQAERHVTSIPTEMSALRDFLLAV